MLQYTMENSVIVSILIYFIDSYIGRLNIDFFRYRPRAYRRAQFFISRVDLIFLDNNKEFITIGIKSSNRLSSLPVVNVKQ